MLFKRKEIEFAINWGLVFGDPDHQTARKFILCNFLTKYKNWEERFIKIREENLKNMPFLIEKKSAFIKTCLVSYMIALIQIEQPMISIKDL